MNTRWILLLAAASGLAAQEVAGTYVLRGVQEVGSQMRLKPDGTFEYMLAYGAADYQSTGTWRKESNEVVLTTTGKEAPPFRLLRSGKAAGKGLRVKVAGPGGQPAQHIDVMLRGPSGDQAERTADDGVATFDGTGREILLHLGVYDVEAGPFVIPEGHNNFEFEINGQAITTVHFKEEKLKIKGNSLEMLFWKREKPGIIDVPMTYQRGRG